MTKITIKQEKFCNKFVECGNASEACRHAYSCDNWKEHSVWIKASKLLKSTKVALRVKELQNELKSKSDITKEGNLKALANIAYTSIASFHKTWVDLKDFEELTDDQKLCIKSIQTRTKKIDIDGAPIVIEEVKIELFDRLKAIDMINKMLGFDAPTKHEHTGKDGKELKLSPLRIEIINATKKEYANSSDN